MAKEIAPELQDLMRQGGPLREQLEVQIYTGRATHEVHAIVGLNDRLVDLHSQIDSLRRSNVGLSADVQRLREAARAVVARWDSPKWKDEAPTADVINELRRALEGGE